MRTGKRPRAAAGQMNRLITIRSSLRADDGMGGYTETPVDVADIWAAVEPLEGREQIHAMQTGMRRPHRMEIRYREDVTGMTQIYYGGRTFDVKSVVDPEERHVVLEILVDEVLP